MRTVLRTIGLLLLALSALAAAQAQSPRGMITQMTLDAPLEPSDRPRTTAPASAPSPTTAAEEAPATEVGPAPGVPESEPPPIVRPTEEGAPPAESPLAPPGEGETVSPGEPGATAPASPPDWRPEPSEENILIDADEVFYQAGATVARGNVVVRYREITVTADQAEIDEDGIWGQFRGNVVITREGVETRAELIRVNFDTETWEVIGGRTVLEPSFFETGVVEPIYVRAGTVSGVEGERVMHAYDGTATSCDLEEPHYDLYSEHLRLIGEETVVLEKPELRFFGHTLLRFPWDLVLSQHSRNNRFFPEFGQNSVEGFFAKLAYLYLTSSTYNSYVRLHLTEKRGMGLGAEHYFRTGPHSGEIAAFWEPDQGAVSGRARHSWQVSDTLTSDLTANLQQNTGYYGATRSLSGNLALRRHTRDSTTTLGLDTSSTDSSASSSSRFTTSFSHRQSLGPSASYDVSAVLRRSEYGATISEILDADLQFRQRGEWYDWALAAEQQWYLSGNETRTYGLDRLPEFVFNTDSQRLGNWSIFRAVPMRATVRAGYFVQYPEEDEIAMAALQTYLGGNQIKLNDRFSMTATASFDQAFYDPSAARYLLNTSLTLDGEYGGGWFSRLTHRYATVEGYSPLRRDYGGRYHDVTLDLTQRTTDRSYLNLSGGYDFVDEAWRELRLRGWLTATAQDRLELVAGYSLEQRLWRPLQVRWTHATPWDVYLAISSNYDLEAGKLTTADAEFDWRPNRLWRLEGIVGYNGYSGDLDDLRLRVTRDLHCWQASLTYDKQSDEVRLNLGIKAFPFEDRDWTVGSRGARGGSYGQYYY